MCDVSLDDALEQNLAWVVTETIHLVNNVLGGIQYAVYFLQDKQDRDEASNVKLIQERTEETASILRSLYDLTNPLLDRSNPEPLSTLCERVRCLLERRIAAHGIHFSIDIPAHFLVQGQHTRFVSQVLYTFLWLRLAELEEHSTLGLTAGEEGGAVSVRITDSVSSPAAIRDEVETGPPGGTDPGHSREHFARQSLRRMTTRLGAGGFGPVGEEGGFRFVVDPIKWSGE